MRELERDEPGHHPPPTRLTIVGPGRVGKAMARAARDAGLAVRLAGREDHAQAAAGADCVLLCVPDDQIPGAAGVTGATTPPPRYAGHVSGATGLTALHAATAAGAEPFSLHPLQTIPDEDADLREAPCAVSAGSPGALAFASKLGADLGMRPFELDEEARAAYHAAAAMSSNFLVTLEETSARVLESAGIGDARELLTPLVMRTARNWADRGAAALTGPIARGDEATITRHLDALARIDADILEVYRVLARQTRSLAQDAEVVPGALP